MSGPGLEHVDSHSAIHEAALHDAMELNDILEALLKNKEYEKGLKTAYVAVEHWEARILQHAKSEEEGLYKDIVEKSPELENSIIRLMRDHDLLRIIIKSIKELLDKEGFNNKILQQFHALVIVDEIHNEEEMKVLPHH